MTLQDERPQNQVNRFERRPGELGVREMARWTWRQLTSMRTALVLLLLLALAAVPGSVIPQTGVDSLKTRNWQLAHPGLTPIYQKLGLFSVYNSPWFSAIYILLATSLVGCIVPRLLVYSRAVRRPPAPAPRNLTRLPDHAVYSTDADVERTLERARAVLKSKGYRLRAAEPGSGEVAAERGYLREAGNLVFHLAVLVVLAGFATGGLFGYQGGVIVVKGTSFSDTQTQYDDFNPGSLFTRPASTHSPSPSDDFSVDWSSGEGRDFAAPLTYQDSPGATQQQYDLKVNHPLTIDGTDVFLIGHGYAPVITVKDGAGKVVYRQPTVFLPQDASFLSFGVVKATGAQPQQIGLDGLLYPDYASFGGAPATISGDDVNPVLVLSAFSGDLGLSSGAPQSVYTLDKSAATQLTGADGKPLELTLKVGGTATLPNGLGSVTFDGMQPWVRLQISKSPGKLIALGGVVSALIGLLGSLFIRPRRVWVKARREGGVTMVEVAALDRSSGGDVSAVLRGIVGSLRGLSADELDELDEETRAVSNHE